MERQARHGEQLKYIGSDLSIEFSQRVLRCGDVVTVQKGGWFPTVKFGNLRPYIRVSELEPFAAGG